MADPSKPSKPKRTRFVPLDPEYASDDRLVDVSRDAEWLFVRCICLSSRLLSDGRLTVGQIRRECADKAETGEITMMLIELVEAGLLVEASSGVYVLSGYVKNNRTAADVAGAQLRKRLGGEFGRHNRYHGDDRVEGCLFCEHPGESFSSVLAIASSESGLATGLVMAKPLLPDSEPWPESESESESESDSFSFSSRRGDPRGGGSGSGENGENGISEGWGPSASTVARIVDAGLASAATTVEQVPGFVSHHRAKGSVGIDFDRAFIGWMQVRKSNLDGRPDPSGPVDRKPVANYHRLIDFGGDEWTHVNEAAQ